MKVSIVFLSMGGAENREELKFFLKNMFLDRNILPLPYPFRWVLSEIISTLRVKSSYENYKLVGGSSPLKRITSSLSCKVEDRLNIRVLNCYRYVHPLSYEVVKDIRKKGFKKLVLFPLYPHFSFTTVKSSLEDFKYHMKREGLKMDVLEIKRFYRDSDFNNLILNSIIKTLKGNPPETFYLLFSAHSIPEKLVKKGDSYESEVREHVEILKKLLLKRGLYFRKILLAYQSRLGPVKWLSPSIDEVLKKLSGERVVVYPISFIIDNFETVFELKTYYRKKAYEYGVKNYLVTDCLNDSDEFVNFLVDYFLKTLKI